MPDKKQTFIYLASVLFTMTIFIIILIGVKIEAGWVTTFDSYWVKAVYSTISTHNTSFFHKVTDFGDAEIISYITLIMNGALLEKRKNNTVIWILMTVIMGTRIVPQILKRIVKRERPISGIDQAFGFSFPSGHSTAASVFYILLIILGIIYLKHNWEKMLLAVAFLTITSLVMYSRVYLGVHYPSDVVGGFFLGISIVLISMGVYYRFTRSKIGTS